MNPNAKQGRRRADLALIAIFVLVLAAPSVVWLGRLPRSRVIDEYRVPEAFPGWTSDLGTLQQFGQDMDRYYADHFGGREWLIAGHLALERRLFPGVAGGVLVGREGWLYSLGNNMLNDYLGISELTTRQLKDRRQELEERRAPLAARGIKYLFVITPNKESIYPQYLPEWLSADARPGGTDQFIDYMRLHSTVNILDLRPVLRTAAGAAPVFCQTDSHWNALGAFVGGEAIVTALAEQYPGLKPISDAQFIIQRTHGTGGDIARYAGRLKAVDENLYRFQPRPPFVVPECRAETNTIGLQRFQTLPVLEFPMLTATNRWGTGRAVVFGDSYTFALTPFLACHFRELIVLRKSFNLSDVERFKPDVVIDEKVERRLAVSFYHG